VTFLALFAAALTSLWLIWRAMDWVADWIERRLCR